MTNEGSRPLPVRRWQLLAFAVVGAIGFVADASALHAATHWLGAGLYSGRVISYLCAATVTWLLNRLYTFAATRSSNRLGEWLRFLGLNLFGGAVNYATYSAVIAFAHNTDGWIPTLGVAAGSLLGAAVNFVISRRYVFRGRAPAPSGAGQ